jgi:DNA-binding NarL/FixJ family response regulator
LRTRSSPFRWCKLMALKSTRILIADDHPVVRRGLRSLLATHEGWEVCGEARTGAEVVQLVKQLNPDILITDISMPEMNGFEALRLVQAFDPHIGILMLTMHDSETMLRGAMEAGAHAYVLKSDLDSRLIEAVEALCEGRAFFSPGISQVIMRSLVGRAQMGTQDLGVLTPRQREVLKLVARGKSNKEVATELGISTRTAEVHRYQVMNRLKVRTLSELILFAVRNHVIEL